MLNWLTLHRTRILHNLGLAIAVMGLCQVFNYIVYDHFTMLGIIAGISFIFIFYTVMDKLQGKL
jgi:hypothetical protein